MTDGFSESLFLFAATTFFKVGSASLPTILCMARLIELGGHGGPPYLLSEALDGYLTSDFSPLSSET